MRPSREKQAGLPRRCPSSDKPEVPPPPSTHTYRLFKLLKSAAPTTNVGAERVDYTRWRSIGSTSPRLKHVFSADTGRSTVDRLEFYPIPLVPLRSSTKLRLRRGFFSGVARLAWAAVALSSEGRARPRFEPHRPWTPLTLLHNRCPTPDGS